MAGNYVLKLTFKMTTVGIFEVLGTNEVQLKTKLQTTSWELNLKWFAKPCQGYKIESLHTFGCSHKFI